MARLKIGEILLKAGLITEAQLKEALERQKKSGERLGRVLVELSLAQEADVAKALADQLRLPFVDLSQERIPSEVVGLLPADFALKHTLIPVASEKRTITLAMADPLNLSAVQDVEFRTGLRATVVVAAESDIVKAIERSYPSEEKIYDLLKDISLEGGVEVVSAGPMVEDVEALKKESTAPPVVRLVNMVLADAIKLRTSDIHIEPLEAVVQVRYRIDGLLRDILKVPKPLQESMISRIKIMSGMDIAERRKPQDGRSKIRTGGREVDLRVSTLPTHYGEKVVIRILDKASAQVRLDRLGFSPEDIRTLQSFLAQPQGMILVTGPTGSGKTSTLYAGLNFIKSETKNIITVEDPIEYQLEGINQVQVNERAGITFARGLRSILRQDPNVIMVGEIRDKETAEIAFQASLTGHLVLSTLHTNDAPSAITRLLDLGIEPYLVASSVSGIIAQRLARRICPDCRERVVPDRDTLLRLGLPAASPRAFFRGKGCEECHFVGYRGRIGIYEVLRMDEKLRRLIASRAPDVEIAKAARAAGMKTLLEDGLEKVFQGIISAEELLRVVPLEEREGPAEALEGPPALKAFEAPPPEPVEGRGRILVADDSPTVLEVVKYFLEMEGFQVTTAKDGMEALEKVHREAPDLIITDVMMPRLDGFGLCRKLREHLATRLIPVIMLTSKGEAESEVMGLEVGADDYIAKPVDPKRLILRVKAILRRSRGRAA